MTDNMFTVPEDMRKVVFCRDCEHYRPMFRKQDKNHCTSMMGLCEVKPDDYCSRGVKRGKNAEK